jgi:AraC-like DNA-binding protein
MMTYREFRPHPLLASNVKLIWTLELDAQSGNGSTQRILPDGIVEAVFHFGEPYLMRHDGEPFHQQPASFAVSQTKRFLEIKPVGRSGFIAIRFYPWGARRFFRLPVLDFADRHVPADQLWGSACGELLEKIAEASSIRERVAQLEGFLLERFDDSPPDVVDRGLRVIWARRGELTVRGLSRRLGVGERILERRFRASTGASPKRMIRLARFLSICRELRRRPENLAHLAHGAGYHDQAHFIKECRAFSGLTPGQLAKRKDVSFLELR